LVLGGRGVESWMGRRSKWYELLGWLLGWYAERFGLDAELKVFGCGVKRRGIRKTGGSRFMGIEPLVHAPNRPTRKQESEGPRRAGGRRSPPGEKVCACNRKACTAPGTPSDPDRKGHVRCGRCTTVGILPSGGVRRCSRTAEDMYSSGCSHFEHDRARAPGRHAIELAVAG